MKDIIILGTGSTRVQCEYDCEVWGVNGAYSEKKVREMEGKSFRLDKLFLTDNLFSNEGVMNFSILGMNALIEECGTKIISLNKIQLGKYKLIASTYPFDRIMEKFDTGFFTSSICHMLAYALDKVTDKNRKLRTPLNIRLYGIDMTTSKEYLLQKGGVEYWLGYAKGLGCEYFVAPGGAVLVPSSITPYGKERKLNMKEIDPYKLLEAKS